MSSPSGSSASTTSSAESSLETEGSTRRQTSFVPNAGQQAALDLLKAGYNVKLVGPAGFGKSSVMNEWFADGVAAGLTDGNLMLGPYNVHKDDIIL